MLGVEGWGGGVDNLFSDMGIKVLMVLINLLLHQHSHAEIQIKQHY